MYGNLLGELDPRFTQNVYDFEGNRYGVTTRLPTSLTLFRKCKNPSTGPRSRVSKTGGMILLTDYRVKKNRCRSESLLTIFCRTPALCFFQTNSVLLDFRLSLLWRTCELFQSQPGGREVLGREPHLFSGRGGQSRGF